MDANWTWNEDKGQIFGTDVAAVKRLAKTVPQVGKVSKTMELLGITATVIQQKKPALKRKPEENAKQDLKRIRAACPDGPSRNKLKRKRQVAQLIIPKLAWGGQWQCPKQKTIPALNTDVGRTVNKSIP